MSKKYYWLLAVSAAAFVVVVGLGLWKTWTRPGGSKSLSGQQQGLEQPYLYPEAEIDPNSDQGRRASLDEAISKYRSSTSFRSTMWRPFEKGELKATIEYVKPLRLHALLEIADQKSKSEIIIVGETVYLKDEANTWKIVNDESIRQFGRDFFAGMLVAEGTLSSYGVPDNAQISYKNKNDKDCLEAKTQYQDENTLRDISFCFNDNKELVYVWMQTKDGDVLTEYKDFNSLITVERPPLPLLERRLQLSQ